MLGINNITYIWCYSTVVIKYRFPFQLKWVLANEELIIQFSYTEQLGGVANG